MNQLHYLASPRPSPSQPQYFRCVLFPADPNRQPSVVQVMTSPMVYSAQPGPRMPHPEAHMDSIAPAVAGGRAWDYIILESLQGMNKQFSQPYIVFYPTVSQDGSPFPINASIRNIQGPNFREQDAWRGNVIIGKFADRDAPFHSFMDAGMADFPLMRNFIRSRYSPRAPP
ncbi:hypothetical protein C8F01DRAFT_1116267 [Mycena amicta]|nr:hypothetical protein C8F01DRAFT_1116267 [Mycena amicta]